MVCKDCRNPIVGSARRGRCEKCYRRVVRREKGYGRWESVWTDVSPVRNHVESLLQQGLTVRTVAELAGIGHDVLLGMLKPDRNVAKIRSDTAKAVLAVYIPDDVPMFRAVPIGVFVDATGTRRRMESLVAYGYTREHIAELLGKSKSKAYISQIMVRRRVRAKTAQLVDELFQRLQLTPGPSEFARQEGRQKGWSVPLAWDEDELDSMEFVDPALKDEGTKPLTLFERYKELRYLGFGPDEIAMRLEVKPYVVRGFERQAS